MVRLKRVPQFIIDKQKTIFWQGIEHFVSNSLFPNVSNVAKRNNNKPQEPIYQHYITYAQLHNSFTKNLIFLTK